MGLRLMLGFGQGNPGWIAAKPFASGGRALSPMGEVFRKDQQSSR
jgi:hypothetical protein